MSRNRTIYNVLAVYASQVSPTGQQTGATDIKQLSRVQSFSEDFTRNFTDVNQYGNLAAIDRVEVQTPEVTSSIDYYAVDGGNESYMGLTVTTGNQTDVSCISGLLSKATDEKNYYLLIADEGYDANSYTAGTTHKSGVIAIGNAYLTSYSIKAAVGDIPTATVNLAGLNVRVYSDVSKYDWSGVDGPGIDVSNGQMLATRFKLPSAIPYTGATIPNALLPGDITLTFPTNTGVFGWVDSDLKVQDFTLSFDLNRTPLQKLGNRFAFSREIDFPVTAKLDINASVGDLQSGNLRDIMCANLNHDFTIVMNKPSCLTSKSGALAFKFKQAKLISQNFSSSIGDNASMSASYEVQLSAANDTARGIFISGAYA